MAIEIGNFPIEICDFHSYVNIYQRVDIFRYNSKNVFVAASPVPCKISLETNKIAKS